jgi:hypothetical protein
MGSSATASAIRLFMVVEALSFVGAAWRRQYGDGRCPARPSWFVVGMN